MLHPPSLSDWSQSEWSWYKQARLFPRLCLHWETPEQHYQSAGFPLHCKVTHYSSLFYTEKLQHACACMHVCKIAVMLGHDKNPERLQALNCSFRYSLISFALTVWLNLFSLSTFVFFFFSFSWNRKSPTFYTNCYIFSNLTVFPQTHQTCTELSFTTRPPRLSKALTLPSEFLWNGFCDVRPT